MKALERTSKGLSSFGSAVASWLKVLLMSRRPSPKVKRADGEEIVVLGNGPSLRTTLADDMSEVMNRTRLAVNFAANTPEFFTLKPQIYVLADPHFFNGEETDANVRGLWENLEKADWNLTLYVPCGRKKQAGTHLCNARVVVKGFNLTPAEGTSALVYPLYSAGLAMPRPRNVLIPSIMIAMREGFKRIYIAGADHTWSRTLGVDEQNRVVSIQPHFYQDTKSEQTRVATEYAGYHLHDILKSLYIAFRSYHQIAAYATRKSVTIYNITPGSFIDAFPRLASLPPASKK